MNVSVKISYWCDHLKFVHCNDTMRFQLIVTDFHLALCFLLPSAQMFLEQNGYIVSHSTQFCNLSSFLYILHCFYASHSTQFRNRSSFLYNRSYVVSLFHLTHSVLQPLEFLVHTPLFLFHHSFKFRVHTIIMFICFSLHTVPLPPPL